MSHVRYELTDAKPSGIRGGGNCPRCVFYRGTHYAQPYPHMLICDIKAYNYPLYAESLSSMGKPGVIKIPCDNGYPLALTDTLTGLAVEPAEVIKWYKEKP